MKWFIRIMDMVFGLSIAGLSGWVIYIAMHEMIVDAAGWYDLEDWLYSIIGTFVFSLIFYSGIKLVVYPIRVLVLTKKLDRRNTNEENEETN